MNRCRKRTVNASKILSINNVIDRRRSRKQQEYAIATVLIAIFVTSAAIPVSSTIYQHPSSNKRLRKNRNKQQYMSSLLTTSESQSTIHSTSSCYYCHLLYPEVLTKDHEGQHNENKWGVPARKKYVNTLSKSYDYNNEVHCLRRVNGSQSMIKHPIAIELPYDFVTNHTSLIENGEAHVCIYGAYESIAENPESTPDIQRRMQAVVQVPGGTDSIEILSHNHPVRILQETNENTQVRANTTSYFFGTKRLLVVRVVTSGYVEQPAETIDEIQGAIFGTGRNPDSIPTDGTVVAQYNAVSQGNLFFTPAFVEDASGVIEVELPTYIQTFINASIRDYLVPEILLATESKLGRPLDQVADYIIFCIPNNSLLRDDSQWTAFTYLYEPVCFEF
jgi:hypothetical protein